MTAMGPPRNVPYSMQMPSGLSARVVIVCILFLGVSAAHAERRQVAVIELSEEEITKKIALDLNPVLVGHPDLQPIKDPSIPSMLYEDYTGEDSDHINNANNSLKAAQTQLGNYEFKTAQDIAGNGQAELRLSKPNPQGMLLYSKLAFLRGQALLGVPGRQAEASYQFALAHRLDPSFVPDAARFLPDVVQAYDAAKKRWVGTGKLQIVGSGRLWIDGKDVGAAPVEHEVDAGPHVVVLTGADRLTAGTDTPIVESGKTTKVVIDETPADPRTKIRRARATLHTGDAAARGGAMKSLAALVGFEHALLLSTANGTVIVQWWSAGTKEQLAIGLKPGFSAHEEWPKGKRIEDLLVKFAPAKKQKPKEEDPKPLADHPRWYQQRKWQATLVVGIAAALIGGYYIFKAATADDAYLGTDGFDPEPAGRIRW